MKIYYGNSIKIYRIQNKLSQEKLADILKISKSMLGMLENNKRNASDEVEERIRKEINISLDKNAQQLLLEKLKIFLIETLNSYTTKTQTKITKGDIDRNITNLSTIEMTYYYKLGNKDFTEIHLLLKDLPKYLPTIHTVLYKYYDKNQELKKFYHTYTSFLLDNVNNLIEILKEYLSKDSSGNEIIVFKERLPLNIVNDFEKIIKNINSTTYSAYTKYKINTYSFEKQIGFLITDDTMIPKYELNNIVIVDVFGELKDLENNKDYLIRTNKNFVIRRIQIKDEQIILKPLNSSYDIEIYTKEDIEKSNIEIIGKVSDIKLN